MSDTAKVIETRLADELRQLADSGPMTHEKTEQMAKHLADAVETACNRIRQLERGIERANVDAAPDGDGGWFSIHDLDKYGEFVAGKTPSASLMQLIEELGQGAD